ncbi:hypothetical protein HF521_003345 [Silurus meridionalis]|uniref:Uncharacterized protein n=1 Tax=Silurus meridionalis TaxID=175797 RepID=A0A8T0B2L3_SILME|nr:hypothetical protein HF521_003345 [Silurus meridionalis]
MALISSLTSLGMNKAQKLGVFFYNKRKRLIKPERFPDQHLGKGRDWKADLSFPLFPAGRVDENQMWSTSVQNASSAPPLCSTSSFSPLPFSSESRSSTAGQVLPLPSSCLHQPEPQVLMLSVQLPREQSVKGLILRQAVEKTQGGVTPPVGTLLAEKMSQYTSLLASQGSLQTAISYLSTTTDQARRKH